MVIIHKHTLVALSLLCTTSGQSVLAAINNNKLDKNPIKQQHYSADCTKSIKQPSDRYLKLESPILSLVDGNFMNADTLEQVFIFKHEIMAIMWGDLKDNNKRMGRYSWNGEAICAADLKTIEKQWTQPSPELIQQRNACLMAMKKDFLRSSDRLRAIARGTKSMMGVLIEESCKKRNNSNSLLMLWAHTPEEKEDFLFEDVVKTAADFNTFCIDLLNFIGDMLKSCPKASKQFEERSKKWRLFESLLATVTTEKPSVAFLTQIKLYHLDKLALHHITPALVRQLLHEFNIHKRTTE